MTTALLDPAETAVLQVEPWTDPLIDRLGHDPRSRYAERFWLPVLGPSTMWLLRRVAAGFDAHPDGFEMDLATQAKALGLGAGERHGRNSPFMRTLARCVDFDMATINGKTLSIRRKLPPLSRRHLLRLPPELAEEHDRYLEAESHAPAVNEMRNKGRLLAMSLAELGEDQATAEEELLRWNFHPALARECAAWAFGREVRAGRLSEPCPATSSSCASGS
jgi:hypothetical protein